MYLEEITIDGFKSYSSRTVIGPFHELFNAISGLNGTGKSNILDAICFVMGIRSLQQMRVSKLDELIYKQGQPGINKASVTLVFRNNNRKTSPVGMVDIPKITISRQIAIGGRDRFVMNGHTVRSSDIQTVFQSVQLNVNNPHFLVMQGRITKVIQMKPAEILGMIEESSGTRLYELKRTESTRKMATKEAKLAEINSVVAEEIEPALLDLRKQQEKYALSLRFLEEYERLERYCRSYEFCNILKEISCIKSSQEDINASLIQIEQEKHDVMLSIASLRSEIESEYNQYNKSTLINEMNLVKEEKKKLQKKLPLCHVTIEEHSNEKQKIESDLEQLNAQLNDFIEKKKMLSTDSSINQCDMYEKQEIAKLRIQESQICDKLQELRTGHIVQGKVNQHSSREKLITAELKLNEAHSELNKLNISIQKWKKEINENEYQEVQTNNSFISIEENIQEYTTKIENLKNQLNNLDFQKDRLPTLYEEKKKYESLLFELKEKQNIKKNSVSNILRFRSELSKSGVQGIKGIAIELFKVKENQKLFSLALEEAAKAKLLNVVVQDDITAKYLFEKFKSIRRLTCIPMNRIHPSNITNEKLLNVKSLLKLNNSTTDILRPLDVIEPLSEKYRDCLSYVFGYTYLCSKSNIAKEISNHPKVKGTAITISGDHYNPFGSISGGSQAGLGGIIESYNCISDIENDIQSYTNILKKYSNEIEQYTQIESEYTRLINDLEILEIQLSSSQKRLYELRSFSCNIGIDEIKNKINSSEERYLVLKNKIIPQLENNEIPQLKKDIQFVCGNRSQQIRSLEKELKTLREKILDMDTFIKKNCPTEISIDHNLGILDEEIKRIKNDIQNKANHDLNVCNSALNQAKSSRQMTEDQLQIIDDKISKIDSIMSISNQTIHHLEEKKLKAENVLADLEPTTIKLQHSLRCYKQQLQDISKRKTNLLRDYSWLEKDFDCKQALEDFDNIYKKNDVMHNYKKLQELSKEIHKFDRKDRKNVVALLQLCEKEFKELKDKQSQLIRDKEKLEEFIEELDVKKKTTLELCWKHVDDNFSTIFSMLLPNSDAHLILTSSGDLADGLKMQVTLNGVETSSLSELSGGQRSLLSLSLILALLKYKPAPLYILDEIDAALDISLTQEIGRMIQSQFSYSQFIIISLKENLFNYADILFKTSFENGSSRVTRIDNTKLKK